MKRSIGFALVLCMMVMAGCAVKTNKYWDAIGGSKADGTVKLAFDYNPTFEKPELNEQQAVFVAENRCKQWGYSSAEAFGMGLQNCTSWQPSYGGPICVNIIVTKEYQCIGKIEEKLDVASKDKAKNFKQNN